MGQVGGTPGGDMGHEAQPALGIHLVERQRRDTHRSAYCHSHRYSRCLRSAFISSTA